MKQLYITARNHMDLTWRRCWEDHGRYSEEIIRPYTDIETELIREYMRNARKFGVVYHIEQAHTVRAFLARNPELKADFAALVQAGKFELAGGGVAVLDYNLTPGEAWVRNHMSARRYYKDAFGITPRYGICPDIFGLPAQLPQFFRSIGYDAVIVFDRVLDDNLPYWRGLDGTLIVLDPRYKDARDRVCEDYLKYKPCHVCGGEGCSVCGWSGLEFTHRMSDPTHRPADMNAYGRETVESMLKRFAAADKQEFFLTLSTEEVLIGERFFADLEKYASQYGFEVVYLGYEDNFERTTGEYVRKLRAGDIRTEEIDPHADGNPMATGCYASRIEVKRSYDNTYVLLCAAERLCTLTSRKYADVYPSEKLSAMWDKLAFLGFHDGITSSHSDASYAEWMKVCRDIAGDAYRLISWIMEKHALPEAEENACTAAVWNPEQAVLSYPEAVFELPSDACDLRFFDDKGNLLVSDTPETFAVEAGLRVRVRVHTDIEPFSVKNITCRYTHSGAAAEKLAELTEAQKRHLGMERLSAWDETHEGDVIEAKAETSTDEQVRNAVINNGILEVEAVDARIVRITDLRTGRDLSLSHCGGLSFSYDHGDPWGRYAPERDMCRVYASTMTVEKSDCAESIILHGAHTDPGKGCRRLEWTQTVTLRAGEDMVRFHNDLNWHGEDCHIYSDVPLAGGTDGLLYTEVPFGTMARGEIVPTGKLGFEDEWPALGFAGVSDGLNSMAVLMTGLRGARLNGDTLQISLHRSPVNEEAGFAADNCTDNGRHVSDFAITAWEGAFADGCASRRAVVFANRGYSVLGRCGLAGNLLPVLVDLPENVRVSAVKKAEDSDMLVIRLWESTGKEVSFDVSSAWTPCDPLENVTGAAEKHIVLRPFEIRTFLVGET